MLGSGLRSRPRMVSLLGMLRNYFPFYQIARDLQELLGTATTLKSTNYGPATRFLGTDGAKFNDLLATIRKACVEHGLSHTADMAKRAAQREATTYDDVYHSLTHLNDSLTSELEREAIFRIAPERKGYFEHDDLLGPEVTAAFQSCTRDIRNAGSCYALEQPDGCVHHLMMVLERGLRALAAKLSVPYQQTNWQTIINKIDSELKAMKRGDPQKNFYREVNAQFGFLKDAYRNHSEHAHDDPYDMPKAQSIFNHVKAFMQELEKGGLTE
jgi:hypothetical protein